jgi:penicillin-binding protein 2
MRIKIVSWLVIALFLFLGLAVLNFTVLHGSAYWDLSNKNCIRLIPQEGARGKILDREGNVIVDNKLYYDAMVSPQGINQSDKVFIEVSRILGIPVDDLKNAYKKGYIASSMPVVIAKNIDVKKAMALEQLKIDFPIIVIQSKPLRHYPYGRLACHVMGYVNEIDRWRLTKLEDYGYKTKDLVGFGGVEEKYDYYLRQEEGGLSVEIDNFGREVRVLGFRPPSHGRDMQLTLNLKVQKIVEKNLAGRKGCVILMDPYTGEIIAMASFPNFNPQAFINKSPVYISSLFKNPEAPLINRAISAAYPGGSLFKVIVATAGLETGKLNLSKTFFCPGKILIGKQEFACWNTHQTQNLIEATTHSCNIFFYRTGLAMGAQPIHDYALKFGLSRPVSFELPYETSGFIPSPLWKKIYRFRNWFDGDTANLSIGQGDVLVTPLQMSRVMAVFANRGHLVSPYIVKAIDGRDISIYQKKSTNLMLKENTIDYIRQGLREVVFNPTGTGSVLSNLSVPVAGKTGTAQAPPGQPHGWFAGFFPFKNPKFVICVFLERGRAGHYACVLAKQIIEEMINEGLI